MLSRRKVLQTTAMAASSLLVQQIAVSSQSIAQPVANADLIDVHCHVFNGSDLPIEGYLKQVIFKIWGPGEEVSVPNDGFDLNSIVHEDPDTAWQEWLNFISDSTVPARAKASSAAAKLCYSYIQSIAVPAQQEVEALEQSGSAAADSAQDASERPAPAAIVRKGVVDFFTGRSRAPDQEAAAADAAPSESPADDLQAQRRARQREYERDAEQGTPHLLEWLRARARSSGGTAGADAAPASGDFVASEADLIATTILESSDYVSRQIRWAMLLRANRNELARTIVALYETPQSHFTLYAPALIDYSKWIDDEPVSDLASQGVVMNEVTARAARVPGRARFHGYMAYDPLRDVLEPGISRSLLRTALNDQGFIGAKVYPTMGFLPLENGHTKGLTYSNHVLAQYRAHLALSGVAQANQIGTGQLAYRLAHDLDAQLSQFYALCVEHDAPILTHATASYGAGPNYASRAHPMFWEPALQAFPQVRVCMAHFGDFGEARVQGDGICGIAGAKKVDLGKLQLTWEWRIAQQIHSMRLNAYADISYFQEVIADSICQDLLKSIEEAMVTLIGENRSLVNRLMYGSDWLLLAREKKAASHYQAVRALMERVYRRIDAAQADRWLRLLFRDNAVRFFGLRRGSGARARLEQYYRIRGLDRSFLDQFDN